MKNLEKFKNKMTVIITFSFLISITAQAQDPRIWMKFKDKVQCGEVITSGLSDLNIQQVITGNGVINIGESDSQFGKVIGINGDNANNKARLVVQDSLVTGSAVRTFTGWVKIVDNDFKWILNTNGSVSNSERFAVQITSNNYLTTRFGSDVVGTATAQFVINEWNHFAVVYDGAKLIYYINGNYSDEFTTTVDSLYDTYTFFLAFNSSASDFRIYDRELSSEEIFSLSGGVIEPQNWEDTQYDADVFPVMDYNPNSDASSLTTQLLTDNGYTNINQINLSKYRIVIEANYVVNSNNIETVLIQNKTDIQILINNQNAASTAGNYDLANKTIFQETYPKAFVFRRIAERVRPVATYQEWENNNLLLDGIALKAFNEEIAAVDSKKATEWLNRYALENPEKLAFLHFNGRGRDPRFETEKFFPGHWLYYPGTYSINNISIADSIITVADASKFKLNFGIQEGGRNDDILMVPVFANGEKNWDRAEQVTLVAINGNQIKVKRGRFGTNARTFNSGIYLAPHAVEGPWGGSNLIWSYNYSENGPTDANGKRCIDVLSDEIAGWLTDGGILSEVNGIQFDIAPRTLPGILGRTIDYDMDGVQDGGNLTNKKNYELGVVEFYGMLRTKLGDNKLIMADGTLEKSQRTASVLNGIESEGFGDVDDVYKAFSKTLNAFNYWNDRPSFILPKLNYVVHKDVESCDAPEYIERERFVLAASQILDAGFNSFIENYPSEPGFSIGIQDELKKGDENIKNWLGSPIGNYIDLSNNASDYWSGNGLNTLTSNTANVQVTGGSYQISGDTLQLSAVSNIKETIITFKDVSIPSGDFTFRFKVKANDSLSGFSSAIPRIVKIEILGGSSYANDAEEILGFINSESFKECTYYVRDLGSNLVDIKITYESGNGGDFTDFKLSQSAQALAREYDNGVILVNPSINDFEFNLSALFPNKTFKRLTASSGQDSFVNNGNDVDSLVTVPPLDGLFLVKTGTNSNRLNINDKKEKNSFRMYPNPSKGLTSIICDECENQTVTTTVYTIEGRRIFSKQTKHEKSIPIDFSNYANGIYIIKVSNKEFSQSTKFIKN